MSKPAPPPPSHRSAAPANDRARILQLVKRWGAPIPLPVIVRRLRIEGDGAEDIVWEAVLHSSSLDVEWHPPAPRAEPQPFVTWVGKEG